MPNLPALPRVMVVDDDEDLRDTMRDWLVRAGYPVSVASNGREALESAASVDVLVTDLKMPEMDGLALLDALKDRFPEIQVIFLSGQATKEDAILALRQGRSYDFLEKPLSDMRRLARAIDEAWGERKPVASDSEGDLPPELRAAIASHPQLVKVFDYVQENLAEALRLSVVADAVGYHPAYLTDLVRRETGQPLARWIVELRMRESMRLLVNTNQAVSQVSQAVGYPDPSHFARLFRRHTGQTPQAWRDQASRQES